MNQEVQDELNLRSFIEPHWFRIEARHWATTDEYGDISSRHSELIVRELQVLKHTPKGAWLQIPLSAKKFVLRDYAHRARAFAASSLALAKEDFWKRKLYRISRLQGEINRVQREIDMLDRPIRTLTFNVPI